jgi:hypothetical protein
MFDKLYADFVGWPAWLKMLLLVALTTLTITITVVTMVFVLERLSL